MNTPSVAEIAMTATRNAVDEVLHKRIQEALTKVGKEFLYETMDVVMLQRVMHRMCNEIGRIATEFDLPKEIQAYYEDSDNGGKVLLFAYEGRIIGKAYLTP